MMKRFLFSLLMVCSAPVWAASSMPPVANLVEKYADVVVNISITSVGKSEQPSFLQNDEEGFRPPSWLRKRPSTDKKEPEEQFFGSGFIIDADGYVLTNAHVVEGASEVLVRLRDKREFAAKVIGSDKRTDIALLKLSATRLPKAVLGDPNKLRVGDWVVAIGSPFGFDSSVTTGIVSAKGRALPDETLVPFIQTDVAINPGNSGGPLFNLKGEVVGINSQIYSRSGGFMGISFAIPIDVAMDVQEQLRRNGRVMRGRIGVMIQGVSQDIAQSFKLGKASGALIGAVEQGSVAEKAGVKTGDIVLSFNSKPVANSIDLPRIVAASKPGTTVPMRVWREGAAIELSVQVAEIIEPPHAPIVSALRNPRGANKLGLVMQDVEASPKKEPRLKTGAQIREAGGAAARLGLRAGDVITTMTVQGQTTPIGSAEQLNRQVNATGAGVPVTLLVSRGSSQSFVSLRIPSEK